MIIYNLELLPLNQKTICGRYYDLEAAEKIIKEYERQVKRLDQYYGCYNVCSDYCEYGDPDFINIKNIGFIVEDLKIRGMDSLICTVNILETPKGKQLKESIMEVVFRSSVWGFIKNDGGVIVERLIGINSFNTYIDAFYDKQKT